MMQYMQLNQYPQPQPNYSYPPNQYNQQQVYPNYPNYPEQYSYNQQVPPAQPNAYGSTPYQQTSNSGGGGGGGSNFGHSDRTLWIGNLHQDVADLELRQCFEQFGNIENVKLVHTKACGFVTFTDAQAASTAHSQMNRKNIHGQEIKVGWGKAESSLPGGGGGGGIGPAGSWNAQPRLPDVNRELPSMEPSRSIWIGNVTPSLTEQVLRTEFGRFGNIEMVRLMLQKNCAFVTYSNVADATHAKQYMDKHQIIDTIIRVNFGKA